MDEGYVKLWRKILESEVFQDDWLFRLFCWCVLNARYQDTESENGRRLGQFVTGRFKAAAELGVSPSRVYTGLKRLEKPPYQCIKVESNTENTVVTVLNFKTYQGRDSEGRTAKKQQSNNEKTAKKQQSNTVKEFQEGKEGEEGKNYPAACAACEKLPDDAALLDWIRWWNALHDQGLVHARCSEDPVSGAVTKAWRRVAASSELRDLLGDRPRIVAETRKANLSDAGWWSLPAMFGGKNGTGEYKLAKLLQGAYRFRSKSRADDDPRGNKATLQAYLEGIDEPTQ